MNRAWYMFVLLVLQQQISFANSQVTCGCGTVTNGVGCDPCGSSYNTSVVLVYQYFETYYTFPDNYTAKLSISNKFTGTLINKYTVLTSADSFTRQFTHTYNNVNYTIPIKRNENFITWGSMFHVVAGIQDLNSVTINSTNVSVSYPGVVLNVLAARQHLSYNQSNGQNNIALLILEDGVDLDVNITLACLPPSTATYPPGENGTLALIGWNHEESNNLEMTEVNFLNLYEDKININDSFLNDTNKGSCNYIVGAGALYRDSTCGMIVVSGIVTNEMNGCDTSLNNRSLTRVSYYLDWIYREWKTNCSYLNTTATTTTTVNTTSPDITTNTTAETCPNSFSWDGTECVSNVINLFTAKTINSILIDSYNGKSLQAKQVAILSNDTETFDYYVADYNNRYLVNFDQNGTFKSEYLFSNVYDVHIIDSDIYVFSDCLYDFGDMMQCGNVIYKLNTSFNILASFSTITASYASASYITHNSSDPNTIFVNTDRKIYIFDRNLNLLDSIDLIFLCGYSMSGRIFLYGDKIYAGSLNQVLIIQNKVITTIHLSLCLQTETSIYSLYILSSKYIMIPCVGDNVIKLYNSDFTYTGKSINVTRPKFIDVDPLGRLCVSLDSGIDIIY